MTKLTKRQQEILNLIQSHMNATGSPPTRAEIAKAMNFRSPNAAEDHLRALARKGVIELVPGTSRGIRLAKSMIGMPIIKSAGLIPGQPLLFEDNITGFCKLDRQFFHTSTDFLIHVHKSLSEFNILEGDYLAVHQTQSAQSGQMMISVMNNEVTIRRHSAESNRDSHTQSVEGVVVGVIRSLLKPSLPSV